MRFSAPCARSIWMPYRYPSRRRDRVPSPEHGGIASWRDTDTSGEISVRSGRELSQHLPPGLREQHLALVLPGGMDHQLDVGALRKRRQTLESLSAERRVQ